MERSELSRLDLESRRIMHHAQCILGRKFDLQEPPNIPPFKGDEYLKMALVRLPKYTIVFARFVGIFPYAYLGISRC